MGQKPELPHLQSDDKLKNWHALIIQLELIDHLFNDPTINEVQLDTLNLLQLDPILDFELFIYSLMFHYSLECNYLNPFVSEMIQFKNSNYRLTLIHSSLNLHKRFKLFLRKMNSTPLTIDNFTNNKKISQKISALIEQKENILITGASGSGKTTFLKTLIATMAPLSHLVVLEDLPELALNRPNISHFITRESFKQNSTQIEINQLCSYVLRINPDRLILGEIRSNEISGLLLCMNCGIKGVMTTLHASSAHEAFNRLTLLYSIYNQQKNIDYTTIMKLIASHFKYVIHLENKMIKEFIQVYSASNEGLIFDEATL
ncbi:MAG: ATPase, T2SS/T4P/T4SS family [Bacteriovoracaceae bacterium]